MTEREFLSAVEQLRTRGLIWLDEDLPGEVDGRVRVQLTAAGRAATSQRSQKSTKRAQSREAETPGIE